MRCWFKFIFIFIIGFNSLHAFQPSIKDTKNFLKPELNLVWQEEFSDPKLNTDKWAFQLGNGAEYGIAGWGNNELQFYTDSSDNFELSDGMLKIIPLYNKDSSKTFTSVKLVTMGLVNFTSPGVLEVKFKIPKGQGLWPAIWMMPEKNRFGGWPKSGEIDLMEARGSNTNEVLSTLHFFQNGHRLLGSEYKVSNENNFNQNFHIITLIWGIDKISFYINNQFLVYEGSLTKILGVKYPFNESFYLILNTAIGGDFVKAPKPNEICSLDNCDDSKKFIVDYIRYYQ